MKTKEFFPLTQDVLKLIFQFIFIEQESIQKQWYTLFSKLKSEFIHSEFCQTIL